jgi:hypothetical protein
MTVDAAPRAPMQIRDVLADAAGSFRARWPWLLGLTVALGVSASLVVHLAPVPDAVFQGDFGWALGKLYVVLKIVVATTLEVCVTCAALDVLEQRHTSIGGLLDAMARSTPALLPIFLVMRWQSFIPFPSLPGLSPTLLTALPALLGLILAIVAAVTVGIVTPVAVEEGGSVIAVIARSWRLMRGARRWALVAIVTVILMEGLPEYFLIAWAVDNHQLEALKIWRAAGITSAIVGLAMAVFLAAFYRELRRVHDGRRDSTAAFD